MPIATMPVGCKPNTQVSTHFTYTIVNNAKKKKATCKLCNNDKLMAHNPTHEADHLNEDCEGYKALEKEAEDQDKTKQQRLLNDSMVIQVQTKHKDKINKELASCLYQTGKPFSLLEDAW